MIVEKNEVLRVLNENKAKKFALRFYSAQATYGKDDNNLVTFETIIPQNSMMATYTHLPDIKISAERIIREEWDNIAYIKMGDEVICERKRYGAHMERMSEEAFEQSLYEQMVENELVAQATGREIIVEDDTEGMAGSIVKGFAQYRKAYKEEKNKKSS
ncbi:hypothetical protein N568_0101300 [Lactococcus garvieae TRF1]|uniref:Uncharacterized protein n=2 Tax=Lactococcus garvieae TaxID=1363 RepID=V8AS04_9LACT|nr:hypothetical protein N568_0101300 [Lactococcus garvieae TRF1]